MWIVRNWTRWCMIGIFHSLLFLRIDRMFFKIHSCVNRARRKLHVTQESGIAEGIPPGTKSTGACLLCCPSSTLGSKGSSVLSADKVSKAKVEPKWKDVLWRRTRPEQRSCELTAFISTSISTWSLSDLQNPSADVSLSAATVHAVRRHIRSLFSLLSKHDWHVVICCP